MSDMFKKNSSSSMHSNEKKSTVETAVLAPFLDIYTPFPC